MGNKNLDRLIDFAIAEEKQAGDLYLDLAKKVRDKGARTMLLDMAGMEKAHKKKLMDFKSGRMQEPASEKVQDLKLAEYMVEKKLNEESGIQDVILFAIQCEKKAHQLYSDISKNYGSGEEMEFLATLAGEELKHKNGLEKAYDDNIFREN
jgi:rubrerythrin